MCTSITVPPCSGQERLHVTFIFKKITDIYIKLYHSVALSFNPVLWTLFTPGFCIFFTTHDPSPRMDATPTPAPVRSSLSPWHIYVLHTSTESHLSFCAPLPPASTKSFLDTKHFKLNFCLYRTHPRCIQDAFKMHILRIYSAYMAHTCCRNTADGLLNKILTIYSFSSEHQFIPSKKYSPFFLW